MRRRPLVAIVPTGINADAGEVMGSAVRADLTVCGALKGIVLHPGARHAGTVRIADISIPSQVVERKNKRSF
jgi:NAD(P)H-hydrate epimerase